VGKPKPPADQARAREHLDDLFGRGLRGDVEVLGRLAEQQVAHAAADDVRLEAGLLEFTNDVGGDRAKFSEPNSVLGLGNGDEMIDGVLLVRAG
jgi:hypothetical protein